MHDRSALAVQKSQSACAPEHIEVQVHLEDIDQLEVRLCCKTIEQADCSLASGVSMSENSQRNVDNARVESTDSVRVLTRSVC
jgi:hypothetical protein